MRVAILTDGIVPYVLGGMQRHSSNLIRNLSKKGVHLTIYHCVYSKEIPTEKEVIYNLFGSDNVKQIKVVTFLFPKSYWFPGHYLYRSKKYSEYIYKDIIEHIENYDFIYAKGFTAWALFKEGKRGKSFPPIGVNFHGYEMWQHAASIKCKIEHYMLRPFVKWNNIQSDYVFSYGGKVSDIIKSIGVNEINILEIPSGIDESWIRDSELQSVNKKINFLFIGRYERRKGIEEINIVIEKILSNKRNIDFHFIGPIPKNKRIPNVIYHGELIEISHMKNIIDQCDVLLCPSYSEGMPNVILEAMARGLAVITTNVGANSLMVGEDNGFLLKDSSVKSLKKAIEYFSSMDKKKLIDKKVSSIEKVKNSFLWSEIAEETIKKIKSKINT